MNETQLIKMDATKFGVSASKAQQIEGVFAPMVEMLHGFEAAYGAVIDESTLEINDAVCKKAKRLRLDIKAVRVQAEKARIAQKEEYLRAGKAIDGVANILKYAVTDKENALKEIEDFFENQEKQRIQELYDERAALLREYEPQYSIPPDLGSMPEDVWVHFKAGVIEAHNERVNAERKAAEERVRQQERNKVFNDRVADAARVGVSEIEQHFETPSLVIDCSPEEWDSFIREQRAIQEEEKKQLEEAAELERTRAEKAEAEARVEREKAEKLKREADAKEAAAKAEAKRIADEKAAQRQHEEMLAKADDAKKLEDFAKKVWVLRDEMPTLKDKSLQKRIKTMIQQLHNACKADA